MLFLKFSCVGIEVIITIFFITHGVANNIEVSIDFVIYEFD